MSAFDKDANSYDGWYKTKLGNFVDRIESNCAFKLLKVEKGMTVLDVGCGTGNFSIKLAEMGCKVIGIDISLEMLNIARKKTKEKNLGIQFYNMDVYNLKFEDEHFDAVFSMAAFEFIKKTKVAIDEIFRVVKKNGQILIGTINKESKWGELYLSSKEDSVFKYADFKTIKDFKSLKKENLISTSECLFIPPDASEVDIIEENELKLSKSERGGFICALWRK